VAEKTFRPVLEKWVESVDGAGEKAHQVGEAVEVKPADDLNDVAAYVAGYTATKPKPFEERSLKYQAWAAVKHATNTRSVTRSSAANHAVKADACKQRYESEESDQDREHGELIVPAADGAHHDFECAECGSPWEIDQDHDTLTSARLANEENAAEAVADGGGGVREQELRERWPSARAAATMGERPPERAAREAVRKRLDRRDNPGVEEVVGEVVMAVKDPPPAEEVKRIYREEKVGIGRSEVAAISRPPRWELKSVEIGEEEHPASVGGGVDLAETLVPDGPVVETETWPEAVPEPAEWSGTEEPVEKSGRGLRVEFPPEFYDGERETLKTVWKIARGDHDHGVARRLSEKNADRTCGECGGKADFYLSGSGFRCAECGGLE
jgi:hypothetical protein